MSKAILVMGMPKCCYQCPCFSITKCRAYKTGTEVENDRTKPNWCPLREVPQKKEVQDVLYLHSEYFDLGYNVCIDEILKGEEENG